MREGWRLEILGEISDVIMGRQLSPSKKLGKRPRPYIRAANIGSWGISLNEIFKMDFTEDEEARFASRIGDTLLVEGGNEKSVGCPGLVTENEAGLCIQNTVIRCRVKNPEVFNPEFQYQVLRYMYWRRDFAELCAGTTIMHLGQKRAELVPILLPPLPEQKRIVDLISSVDSYIESLQQQLETAKRSRNAVLHELLTAGGDDWVVRKLPEVVEVLDRMRKPINSTEREDRKGNIPYYGANGQTGWIDEFIFNEELVLLGEDAIDFADPSARKAYLIQGPSWVNNHAHVLRADKTIVNFYFLMESLNKVDYSQYVSFGTRSKLTQASMNGIKLLIPPMNIQEKFVDLLENFDKVIEATQRSIEDSKELRTGMLSNLLSGEHEIPTSYDKFIGAA
jgi:type I restriction enzyme S subunit